METKQKARSNHESVQLVFPFKVLNLPSVEMSMCVSVSSLLRYRLNVFLPPLPKVGCPKFLETLNPWGKVMERSGLRFEHFCLEVV